MPEFLSDGVDVLKRLYLHVIQDFTNRRNINWRMLFQFLNLVVYLAPHGLELRVLKLIKHFLVLRKDDFLYHHEVVYFVGIILLFTRRVIIK